MHIQIGRFRLGLRTLKTVVTLILIMIVMELMGRGDLGTMVAGVSAVVVLRENFKSTVQAAPGRLVGQALGGLLSIIYFLIYSASGHQFWVKVTLIALSIMLIIVILDGFHLNAGIVGGTATLLMIAMSIPVGTAINYAIERVFDSFIGVIIAVVVNAFFVEDGLIRTKRRKEESK